MARSRSRARKPRDAKQRQVLKPNAQRRPSENTRKRAAWAGMLLEAGQEFEAFLPLDEASYQRVAGPAHADARAYFAYSATQLVLATSASILRWLELLEKMEEDGQKSAPFWTESILDEQNGRIRKLSEALMDLICFRDTNEDGYYRHLLLLRELNRARGTQNDLGDFYACRNRNIQAQVERAAQEISELEASGALELGRCWYKRGAAKPSPAAALGGAPPGQLLASARLRLMKALGLAEGHEKLALGMSYDRLYSRTSGYIHFEPEGKLDGGVAAVSRALDECGILGLNIVVALQSLLGDAPGEWNEKVRQLLHDNPYPAELAELRTRGVAEVGDLVLAYGDLAEVLDIAESDFRYRSYKVLYISVSPMPGIDEDWFPAQFVRVLWSRQGLEQAVRNAVADGAVPEELAGKLLAGGGQEHFREAAAEVWAGGLKEFVHAQNSRMRATDSESNTQGQPEPD